MAFTFETSGNNTFLVYAVEQEDTLDTMTLGMLTNNRIPGMIPVLYTQMNRDCYLKYNVTARVTLRQFFSGTVNRRRLLGVFSGVTAALASAEEYMIDICSLLLDMDHIYADVRSCAAEVICLPLMREAGAADISMFFKNIMFSTQFDQTENCDYVARIINYLNGSPVFVVEGFQKLLEELQSETGSASPVPGDMRTVGGGIFRPVSQAEPAVRPSQAATPQPVPAAPQPIPAVSQPVPVASQHAPTASQPVSAVPQPGTMAAAKAVTPSSSAGKAAASGADFPIPKQKAEERSASSPGSEKEISMLYLLQHYNKENAAAYKAQREARKKSGKASSAGSVSAAGFAVPGQNPGMQPGEVRSSAPVQQPSAPVQQLSAQASRPSAPAQMPRPSVQTQQPPQQFQAGSQKMPAPAYSQEDNFGDTVVMGAEDFGEDTVVMGESMAASVIRPYLLRGSNNERIYIDKPVFHIGKERSYVDYCISGNATVSRSHADIISRNGQFFIVDNNSTNHTYVDGQMIPSNTEVALSHGTKIRLSNEEFEFLTF